MLKHCFPTKPSPSGQGYGAIQHHHKHLKMSMKDVLFELATSNKLMHPVRGIVPGLPFQSNEQEQSDDNIDKKISAEDSQWTKMATKYVKECITPDSRYKLRKFIEDDMLNRIQLDKTLFHIPKSHGSYVDARTGRRTIRGANAKKRPVSSSDQGCDNELAMQGQTTKIRKCPPQDALYVVLSLIQKT